MAQSARPGARQSRDSNGSFQESGRDAPVQCVAFTELRRSVFRAAL